MILESLAIRHFRNIESLDWQPHPRANLLLGLNAQGKTNLLEAIFLLGTTKSLRQAGDGEMIADGQAQALVKGQVFREEAGASRSLEVLLSRQERKTVRLNDKNLARFSEIFGHLSVVLFTPEDLQLVKAGPQARRFYLDLEISQASPQYLHSLQVFERALKQRNSALKMQAEGRAGRGTAQAFEQNLVQAGSEVVLFRLKAVEELEPLAARVQERISGGTEKLGLSYLSSLSGGEEALPRDLDGLADRYRRRLKEASAEEEARATTLVGPHRDDIRMTVNGRPARAFASQGQQRTAALALKLAEVEFLKSRLGENPVLLLDDVLSELDGPRQRELLGLLDEKVQTFVTSTHAEDLPFKPGQVLQARKGSFAPPSAA